MTIPSEVNIKLIRIKSSIDKLITKVRASSNEEEIQQYLELIKMLKKEYRILRGEYDVLFFAYEYFSDRYNPNNDDNLIPDKYTINDAPSFHRELCGILDTFNEEATQKIAWSVPRGHGKSAYLSNIYPVHQLVYNKRKFILIVSETSAISQKFVEWISGQLKFNEKLREDFGELLSQNKNGNEKDNQEEFVTKTGNKVMAISIGKQCRGIRFGAYRPDLIILDDLESAKNTNTKELRDKNLHWFNSALFPAQDVTRTGFIYMGTLVHGLGLLPAVLNRSDFKGRIYSAITGEPAYPELWGKVEEMLRDVDNPNREEEVEKFYYENKEKMDQGASTLWEDRFSYLDLIKIKVNIGSKAYSSEYLNKPSDQDSCVFNPSYFQYFDDKDLYNNDGSKMSLDVFSFWDIAIGKNSRSDYNAIVTVGRDRRTGVMYVIDCWAAKIPMHKALEIAEQKIRQYKPKIFAVETIQAQYDMYRQLRERTMRVGLYNTRVLAVNPTAKKEERIEQLEPIIEGGYLRLKKSQRLLIEQLEQFPSGDYDDCADALASVIDVAGKQRKKTYWKKPTGF